ncbi:unnamed protein product [Oikopleura dioica]|uniref:Uncharacterized protein n=1 Tax=Oikopleura dioica TaxID=34765 RepID=E4XID0_OIKDI|nr:unnamed protein product [Oikopleura dioica]
MNTTCSLTLFGLRRNLDIYSGDLAKSRI